MHLLEYLSSCTGREVESWKTPLIPFDPSTAHILAFWMACRRRSTRCGITVRYGRGVALVPFGRCYRPCWIGRSRESLDPLSFGRLPYFQNKKWERLRFGSFLHDKFCGLHTIIGIKSLCVAPYGSQIPQVVKNRNSFQRWRLKLRIQ